MGTSSVPPTPNTNTPRTCPCKRLPLAISSLTGAEWGDLHSLQQRGRSLEDIVKRQDSAGNTPLHLAAQHGHVAATKLLLEATPDVNASSTSGATPLHRASFSGAVGTMQLLLQRTADCDLLLPDTSFGDFGTALHKAAAGGRYLAVQVLCQVHAQRGTLSAALKAQNAAKLTPLQVAQRLQLRQAEERASVARWNVVAGGVADWDLVCQILQQAQRNGTVAVDSSLLTTTTTTVEDATAATPTFPSALSNNALKNDDCLDCEAGGVCVTNSWEQAFQRGLMQAISRQAAASPDANDVNNTVNDAATKATTASSRSRQEENQPKESSDGSSLGRSCDVCTQRSFCLYPSNDGRLLCRACKRAKR